MTSSRDVTTDKARNDLIALMKELESVESSAFDKHTASRLVSWSHTWLKAHGHGVIAALAASDGPMDSLSDGEWFDLYRTMSMSVPTDEHAFPHVANAGRAWLAGRKA